MTLGVAVRWVLRESRGARGRMLFFVACLAIGVAAVVGVASLSASIAQGFSDRSREILGADVAVGGGRPLPADLDGAFAALPGTERTDMTEAPSMVAALGPDGRAVRSRLAVVQAVTGRYPLYGEMTTDPPGGLAAHLADGTIVVPREVLDALEVRVGDDLVLGGAKFRIAAAVVQAPQRMGMSAFLGPTVYVTSAGRSRTGLLGMVTRMRYRALFALPPGATREELDAAIARVRDLPTGDALGVDAHYNVGPVGGRTTVLLDGFLGLVALLSLIVGGIGVAQIVRTWVAGRTQAIAVLRCLGLRPGEILMLSLGHVGLLAVVGSVAGTALGCALPLLADSLMPDLVPGGMPIVFPLGATLRGLVLGLGISLVFSLPPLTAVWRVSPARVLRSDAAPLPAPRAVATASVAALVAAIFAAAWVEGGQRIFAVAFTVGFALLALTLWACARALVALAARIPRRRMNAYLAHGIAALARPGAGTTSAVVALGLGTMVVVATWLVQDRLHDGFLAMVPSGAPSVYVMDVKPEQWPGVETALRDAGATGIDGVPVVIARIAAIDGRTVEEIAAADDEAERVAAAAEGRQVVVGRSRRSLTRPQRLTSRATLTPDNRIVAGALWSDPARTEVSVEEGAASQLGLRVGSTIRFDVQGVPLEVVVTSVRSVQWQSFAINFFYVLEPGALDTAKGLVLASARVPPAAEAALRDRITRECPNASIVQVGQILEDVGALVGRLASGVSMLGGSCVAAGLLVLAGSASATMLRRRREIALLKVLGVTRGGVSALLAVEYGLVGAVAGLVGAGGALLLAWGFLTYVAPVDNDLPWIVLPVTMLACAVATAAGGLAAGARALAVRPIEALRQQGS